MYMRVETGFHHIRKHILKELAYIKKARFRDLKPKNIDSNLYSYHLKEIIKDGYIEQTEDKKYRLSPMGLRYADHVSLETFEPRWQPKTMTVMYIENDQGEIVMWPKHKQPFIGRWSLPSGKMHYEDESIESAAKREITYLSEKEVEDLKMVGIVHYRAFIADDLVTHTIAYVFRGTLSSKYLHHSLSQWVKLDDIGTLKLSPGTRETIELARTSEQLSFASYDIDF